METHLALGLPSALDIRNHYADILENRTSECPTLLASDSIIGTWEGGCEAQGHQYYGTGIFVEIFNGAPDVPYDMALQSSFEITEPEGTQFIEGGILTYTELDRGSEFLIEQSIGGSYLYSSQNGWLQAGITASWEAEISRDGEGERGHFQGGVGYADLQVSFDGLQYDLSACPTPFGDFRIRDPNGYWHHIRFTRCTECAEHWWNDTLVGEVCLGTTLIQAFQELGNVERR
jgi:hypothetical protein